MDPIPVFLTIDTEHSIGGAFDNPKHKPVGNGKRIYGRFSGKEYGIPLVMDIAEQHDLRLCFFVEVLNRYFFGRQETEEVVSYIRKRGHDVQLHVHPNYLNFTTNSPQGMIYSDLMGNYQFDDQVRILARAKKWLTDYGAENVIAFRAGSYGADIHTLSALSHNDFLVDSSCNRAYIPDPCLLPDWDINDISVKKKMFEFPITIFNENSGLRARRFMPLDINGVSFEEIRHVLKKSLEKKGPSCITIILHSFSFIKTKDVQYNQTAIRRHVIHRFKKLCRFLGENKTSFNVMTFGDLTHSQLNNLCANARHIIPQVPRTLSLMRFSGQLWDRIA